MSEAKVDPLDRDLDDLVKDSKKAFQQKKRGNNNKRGRGRGRGGSRRGRGSGRRNNNRNGNQSHPLSRNNNGNGPIRRGRDKSRMSPYGGSPVQQLKASGIMVSNLARDIQEEDLQEIFGHCGEITNTQMSYDKTGSFLGNAQLTFAKRGVAEKAAEEFDQAEVDGKTMYVKLIGTMKSAINVVKKNTSDKRGMFGSQLNGNGNNFNDRRNRRGRGGRRGGRGRGGRRGGRNGSKGRGNKKSNKPVSLEDLDAEMDSYQSSRVAASTDNAETVEATA